MGSASPVSGTGFRHYLPGPGDHPLPEIDRADVRKFSKACIADPRVSGLFKEWADSLNQPFLGVTTNGVKIEDVYSLQDQGAPVHAAMIAANQVVDSLAPTEKLRVFHSLASEDWRKWTNTEIIAYDIALRLEDIEQSKIDLIWQLLKICLSENGYARVRLASKLNKFLGKLAETPTILNENSYGFMLFGRPSLRQPWGFSLSGHHIALNIFFIGKQMTIAPAFIGSEPTVIDEGPDSGAQLFHTESVLALKLIRSLSPELLQKAKNPVKFHQPDNKDWNIVDQRHRAGAGRDNRIIPYEGLVASLLAPEQQELLLSLIAEFQLLPAKPLQHYLGLARQHLSETYITWTGEFGDDDPFYFRIQSPVVLVEMDHHSGIYLSNRQEPGKHHIHTVNRLPNGGDYGRELIKKWKEGHPGKPAAERMEYIRPFDEEATVDSGFPKYRVQILACVESGMFLASHIGKGGCGPGLHYHHSDQLYYLARGNMTVRLGDTERKVETGSLVFIPAGLPHCNWNNGPGSETHLEMIIPAPNRLEQIAYMIEKPEDVPERRRTTKKGYVHRVVQDRFKEPLPGFKILPLADPSSGSDNAMVMYAEVEPNKGGPGTHVHEFDQFYFVLEGELTIEVALQKHIVQPNSLVVLPAGVPHRQYNAGTITEKHVTINTPPPELGRCWDYGVNFAANGDGHHSKFGAGKEVHGDALLAG